MPNFLYSIVLENFRYSDHTRKRNKKTLNSKIGELGEGYLNYRWYDSFVGKYVRYIKTRTNKGVWKVCRSQDGNKILTIFPSIPFELERFFFLIKPDKPIP